MTAARSAHDAGIRHALLLADEAAAAIRARSGAQGIRQQAAAEALQAFADAVRASLAPEAENAVLAALRAISGLSGAKGEISCPACAGRLHWTRDEGNGHVRGQCEKDDCLNWMQ